ncbi:MAG: Hpt domain-containing protein, partial [Alphaproteobacteria bacterium]|nr:Hpt domain-containing protein [Alphaproteobacteria bacterium]
RPALPRQVNRAEGVRSVLETQQSASDANVDAFDIERIKSLQQMSGSDFFDHLVAEFLSEANESLDQLSMAFETRNLEQIRLLAHALKSSSVNFGASTIVQTCEAIEYGDGQTVLDSSTTALQSLREAYAQLALALTVHMRSECKTTRQRDHHLGTDTRSGAPALVARQFSSVRH